MKTNLVWFRQDLRCTDNPSLSAAAQNGEILPIYIYDNKDKMGKASLLWAQNSLQSLNQDLDEQLCIFEGNPLEIILDLCQKHQIKDVYWNRRYEPWQINLEEQLSEKLLQHGINTHTFNGSLLWEPTDVLKSDQTPYRVFTPFYKEASLNAKKPRKPIPKPRLKILHNNHPHNKHLKTAHDIDHSQWEIGEAGAQKRLKSFLNNAVQNYKKGRDIPSMRSVSMLSPHLHFGEISPHQIWEAIDHIEQDVNTDHFRSELGWREFSYSLLYFNPTLPHQNLQAKFDHFPWKDNPEYLQAWQIGMTGIPMVDAGMRQLLKTGYMHNRVRMIVASFLVKNLMIDWRQGAAWFWDHLFDADLASNSASWQWVAGCGADAAPYFRIFNPVTQGLKFDPDGTYVKTYIPELQNLDAKYIHCPWDAPSLILADAGIHLGTTYPQPIVDLKQSRQQALDAYAQIKDIPNA